MANELYRSCLSWYGPKVRSTNYFYWIVNNPMGVNSFDVSAEINAKLFSGFGWLFEFTGCISTHVSLSQFRTRRISEPESPTCIDVVPRGAIPGRLEGRVDTDFDSAWLKWHSDSDSTGKHGIRLGPIPAGQFKRDGWGFVLKARVQSFWESVRITRTTSSGVEFLQAVLLADGTAEQITDYTLTWPPSRQLTRRQQP